MGPVAMAAQKGKGTRPRPFIIYLPAIWPTLRVILYGWRFNAPLISGAMHRKDQREGRANAALNGPGAHSPERGQRAVCQYGRAAIDDRVKQGVHVGAADVRE